MESGIPIIVKYLPAIAAQETLFSTVARLFFNLFLTSSMISQNFSCMVNVTIYIIYHIQVNNGDSE